MVIKWSSHYWSVLLNEFNGKPAVSTPKRSHTPQKGAVYSSPFGNKGSPQLLSTQSPLKTSKGGRREGRRGERGGREGGRRERCREDMNGRIIIFYFLEDKGTLSDEEKDECYMSLANCAMYQNDTELALKYYRLVPTAQSSWNQSQVGITLY